MTDSKPLAAAPAPSNGSGASSAANATTTTTSTVTANTSNNNVTASNAFAQAQVRLQARRETRETALRAQAAAQQSASQLRARLLSQSQSPLLRHLGASAVSLWDTLSSREGTRPAFRVGQVDASLLDDELVTLLGGQVGDALRYIGSGAAKDDWADEIALFLRAALFKLTVWDHDATYGASLQNLRYTDARAPSGGVLVPPSRWQKGAYGLVTVGGRYLWTKWQSWLVEQDEGFGDVSPAGTRVQRLARLTNALSTAHTAAALASFLVFLLQGRYRTLLDRVLRMRLAPPTSQVGREVSFEYLNRQLVWHAFTEFLLFVLPLVGINKWRRWLARTWRRTRQMVSSAAAATRGETDGDEKKDKKGQGELAFLPERTCAICYQDQNSSAATENEVMAGGGAGGSSARSAGVVGSAQTDITNPYETIPCGCVYCFVCLATHIEREEGEGWTCLRCAEVVKECRPWSGDVLEPAPKSPSPKTVVFADDVKKGSEGGRQYDDDGEVEEEEEEEEEGSEVLVGGEDIDKSVDDLQEQTPSVSSDQGEDDEVGSESEGYEEEEDELGSDVDREY